MRFAYPTCVLLSLGWIVACGGGSPPPPSTDSVMEAATPDMEASNLAIEAPEPLSDEALCAALTAYQRAALDKHRGPVALETFPDYLKTCHVSKGGAWGFAIQSITEEPEQLTENDSMPLDWGGTLELVHFQRQPRGEQPIHAWTKLSRPSGIHHIEGQIGTAQLGSREYIFVGLEVWFGEREGLVQDQILVWDSTGKHLKPTEGLDPKVTGELKVVGDKSGDGVMDVQQAAPFTIEYDVCQGMYPTMDFSFPLLRETTPDGSFKLNTKATRTFARQQCPQKPTTFVADNPNDTPGTLKALACAKLWGVPTKTLQKAVDNMCDSIDLKTNDCDACRLEDAPQDCTCDPVCIHEQCGNRKSLHAIVAAPVPFTLK
ncbi:MAG: hypothetical protein AAFX99_22330 [Myxococcota bacterium]